MNPTAAGQQSTTNPVAGSTEVNGNQEPLESISNATGTGMPVANQLPASAVTFDLDWLDNLATEAANAVLGNFNHVPDPTTVQPATANAPGTEFESPVFAESIGSTLPNVNYDPLFDPYGVPGLTDHFIPHPQTQALAPVSPQALYPQSPGQDPALVGSDHGQVQPLGSQHETITLNTADIHQYVYDYFLLNQELLHQFLGENQKALQQFLVSNPSIMVEYLYKNSGFLPDFLVENPAFLVNALAANPGTRTLDQRSHDGGYNVFSVLHVPTTSQFLVNTNVPKLTPVTAEVKELLDRVSTKNASPRTQQFLKDGIVPRDPSSSPSPSPLPSTDDEAHRPTTGGKSIGGMAPSSRPTTGGKSVGGKTPVSHPTTGGKSLGGKMPASRPSTGGKFVGGKRPPGYSSLVASSDSESDSDHNSATGTDSDSDSESAPHCYGGKKPVQYVYVESDDDNEDEEDETYEDPEDSDVLPSIESRNGCNSSDEFDGEDEDNYDAASEGEDEDEDDDDSQIAPVTPKKKQGATVLDDLRQPYPAPAASIIASRNEPAGGRKWRLFEQDLAIKHMLDIRDEDILRGETRFAETSARLSQVDNIIRSKTAVKNFWNRIGRARSNFDERKNRKAPLSTSHQGKTAEKVKAQQKKTPTVKKQTQGVTKSAAVHKKQVKRFAGPIQPEQEKGIARKVTKSKNPGGNKRKRSLTPDSETDGEEVTNFKTGKTGGNGCDGGVAPTGSHRDSSPDEDFLRACAVGVRAQKRQRFV